MRTPIAATVAVLVFTGCVNAPPQLHIEPVLLNIKTAPDISEIGTTGYSSRYVTESSVPARQVRDVLSNEMDVNIPQLPNSTLRQRLDFLLSQAGYRVRPPQGYAEEQLYQQRLPIVHMNMGYMSFRQAQQVIRGEPWTLEKNVVKREVGFKLRYGYVWNNPYSDNISVLTVSINSQPVEMFNMNDGVNPHVDASVSNAGFSFNMFTYDQIVDFFTSKPLNIAKKSSKIRFSEFIFNGILISTFQFFFCTVFLCASFRGWSWEIKLQITSVKLI